MQQKLFAVFALMVLILPSGVLADGTPAGTSITNFAKATYVVGSTTYNENSNIVTTIVAEMLDVNVEWQDTLPVTVSPGDTAEVLTFLVTNIGNGTDSYDLSGLSAISTGDEFNPEYQSIYYDSNNSGAFDGLDVQSTGGNFLTLAAGQARRVFLFNNIPLNNTGGAPLVDDDTGFSELTATSRSITGTPAAGTSYTDAGDPDSAGEPTDAIVGTSGAINSATGSYIISTVIVSIFKSFEISNDFGTSDPVPGATIKYTLLTTVTGSPTSTAEKVTISDNIPVNTTYTPNRTFVETVQQTDGSCTVVDPGDTTVVTAIEIALGNLTAGTTRTIAFEVTID